METPKANEPASGKALQSNRSSHNWGYRITPIRVTIFSAWISCWVLCCMLVMLLPSIRGNAIDPKDKQDAVFSITVIFMPVIGCWTGFWFLSDSDTAAHRRRYIGRERAVIGIVTTFVYLALILFWVFDQ